MLESKIQKEICDKIMPLFDVWKQDAKWTEEEAIVMYHKLFDNEKPDDETIQCILADKLNKDYLYYHKRKINRIYKISRS